MKPLLFVLLAASLIANVALVVLSRRPAPPVAPMMASDPTRSGTGSASAPGSAAPTTVPGRSGGTSATAATVPMAWPTASTDQDLHLIVAGLRAAGYPASIIRAVINQLLNERFAARSPNAGQPFWKRGQPTAEILAKQTGLNNERQALFESLLGPDARPSALLDADARERRYGEMPADKIDAIAKIERDYQEISAESAAKRKGATNDYASLMQAQLLMEKEKLADLAGVLTPEELTQYEMRNSAAARTLVNNLRNVEVTAAEYAQLYQAQKDFAAATPPVTTMDAAIFAQRQLAQLAFNEQAKAVLGDARFYSYLEGADPYYATMTRDLAKYPTVTPATAYQVYQLQMELQSQMTQTSRTGPMTPEAVVAMQNTVATYNTKLETLVGPAVAEAYRTQGMGRIFSAYRPAPRAAATATSLVPAGK